MRRLLVLLALVSSTTAAQDAEQKEASFTSAECTREKISVYHLNELEPSTQDASEAFSVKRFEDQWWVLGPDRDGVFHRYDARKTSDEKVMALESKRKNPITGIFMTGHFIVRLTDGRFIHTLPRDRAVHVATGNCVFRETGSETGVLIELAEPR